MLSATDIFVEQYKTAAADGAVIELKLRLLADKTPGLQAYAHAQRLEDIEAEVARHFGGSLSEEEKKTLALCRQLRNKVLHCNFRAAREKLGELGVETHRGGVRRVDLAGLSGTPMVERIRDAIAGAEDTFEYVADTSSTDPGSVFAWLVELGTAGDFRQASDAFRSAAAIVERSFIHGIGGVSA